MHVICVTVQVKPEFVRQFINATLDNARGARKEPGNVRFDVLQSEDDPARFTLYEAYRSRAGHLEHQKTEHYLKWKNAVADWMAQPRQAAKFHSLFFGEEPTPST